MRWRARAEAETWTAAGRDAVMRHGAGLVESVPADIAEYCPAYTESTNEQRRDFWVGLMSALARWESGYQPEVSFQESFNDSSGRPVISRGLLQISQESANGYGCGIADARQLHDPATNLACGVRILNRQVTRAGRISSNASPWVGAASYWSPFRNAERRADIAGWTSAQPFCRR